MYARTVGDDHSFLKCAVADHPSAITFATLGKCVQLRRHPRFSDDVKKAEIVCAEHDQALAGVELDCRSLRGDSIHLGYAKRHRFASRRSFTRTGQGALVSGARATASTRGVIKRIFLIFSTQWLH
jgi:hypothetical protein